MAAQLIRDFPEQETPKVLRLKICLQAMQPQQVQSTKEPKASTTILEHLFTAKGHDREGVEASEHVPESNSVIQESPTLDESNSISTGVETNATGDFRGNAGGVHTPVSASVEADSAIPTTGQAKDVSSLWSSERLLVVLPVQSGKFACKYEQMPHGRALQVPLLL